MPCKPLCAAAAAGREAMPPSTPHRPTSQPIATHTNCPPRPPPCPRPGTPEPRHPPKPPCPQVGAWVPAERFELAPADSLFVRMGARDSIMTGQSTFFVELAETAAMLRKATSRWGGCVGWGVGWGGGCNPLLPRHHAFVGSLTCPPSTIANTAVHTHAHEHQHRRTHAHTHMHTHAPSHTLVPPTAARWWPWTSWGAARPRLTAPPLPAPCCSTWRTPRAAAASLPRTTTSSPTSTRQTRRSVRVRPARGNEGREGRGHERCGREGRGRRRCG